MVFKRLDRSMHIVITGGAGFIGSHTVDACLNHGYQVTVLDNLSSGKLSYLDLARLNFIQADVLDYPTLKKTIENCDAVLHLAAIASVPQSIQDPIHSHQVNTLGFLHVLQAIRESERKIRLVYASSAAVYGAAEQLPCREEAMSMAVSPYALDKANNERYADLYARLFSIQSLGLRYFNVYGARQDPQSPYSGVISKFIDCYQKTMPITIFGDGEQSRDFIHVSDVARANVLALQQNYCGVLNIATGAAETVRHLVRYIEAAGGKAADIALKPPRVGDIQQSYADVSKAMQYLKFRSTIPLQEGVGSLL